MENRIVIVIHPNQSMLTISTTARLCDYQYTFSPPDDSELSKRFLSFRKKLNKINGVQKADIGRHEIRVERYEAFRWNECIPAVIAALAKFAKFGEEFTVYVKDERATHEYHYDNEDDFYGNRGARIVNLPIDFGLVTKVFADDYRGEMPETNEENNSELIAETA